MSVIAVVVAPWHERAMRFIREQGWNPQDVVVVTPGTGFHARGLHGVPVHWTGWSPDERVFLTDEDERALWSIRKPTPG